MEIIIGRDPKTASLMFSIDGNPPQTVRSVNVPASVIQQHCKLIVNNGRMVLQNLDINHYTFVNGRSIESKIVTQNDKVSLGTDHYQLEWNLLKSYLPVSIGHLSAVWDNFESQTMALNIKERKFNSLRSATGLITMLAIALSIVTGGRNKWYVVLYGVAIIASLVFFIKAYLDSSKIPQKKLDLSRQLQQDYVCPRCRRYLGSQPYNVLAQSNCCPYCKTQFIH